MQNSEYLVRLLAPFFYNFIFFDNTGTLKAKAHGCTGARGGRFIEFNGCIKFVASHIYNMHVG